MATRLLRILRMAIAGTTTAMGIGFFSPLIMGAIGMSPRVRIVDHSTYVGNNLCARTRIHISYMPMRAALNDRGVPAGSMIDTPVQSTFARSANENWVFEIASGFPMRSNLWRVVEQSDRSRRHDNLSFAIGTATAPPIIVQDALGESTWNAGFLRRFPVAANIVAPALIVNSLFWTITSSTSLWLFRRCRAWNRIRLRKCQWCCYPTVQGKCQCPECGRLVA